MIHYNYIHVKILWEKKKLFETSNFFIYNSILYQKGYLYFYPNSLELFSATSLDLDQSRIPPFGNETLYCGKKLWE